jgi:hypothetical protein
LPAALSGASLTFLDGWAVMEDIWEKTQKEWIKNLLLACKPNALPGKNYKGVP